MVSVVTHDSRFKRTGVLLDSKWRSVFPFNVSHFLSSPCAQTTVFSLCLRSLKCPLFLLQDHSAGITKEKQLQYYPCQFSCFSLQLQCDAFISEGLVCMKERVLFYRNNISTLPLYIVLICSFDELCKYFIISSRITATTTGKCRHIRTLMSPSAPAQAFGEKQLSFCIQAASQRCPLSAICHRNVYIYLSHSAQQPIALKPLKRTVRKLACDSQE